MTQVYKKYVTSRIPADKLEAMFFCGADWLFKGLVAPGMDSK